MGRAPFRLKTSAPRTVEELIAGVAARLRAARLYFGHGTETALDEAAWLVGGALGIEPADLDAHLANVPRPAEQERIATLTAARIGTRKPLAYLLHEAWFAGLKYYVDERVIVPRSLTGELILEGFAPWVDGARVKRVLDLCTGSGCMAIACAQAFPQARVDAVDISADALAVARINVDRHALAGRVRLVRSDLFAALGQRRYDVIVSNPPYVDARDLAAMPPEYRHEPALALAAGRRGLDIVARILRAAPAHLSTNGLLVVEVGNSRAALERAYPRVPFLWATTSGGDDSVFLLTAGQLASISTPTLAARPKKSRRRRKRRANR